MILPRWLTVAALLLSAVSTACAQLGGSPTTPTPTPTPGGTVYYTAVGASDTAGVGSSAMCVPFTECPNGMGYVPVLVRQLQSDGIVVSLSNLGIPAAVISPGFQALGIRYGRTIPANFLEQEMPFVPRNSTAVSIFAGGNETYTVSAAVGGGAAGSDIPGYVAQQIRAFEADFASLIEGIQRRAPSTRLIVMNLPNFAGIPMTAGYPLDQRRLLQRISVGFTTEVINPLAGRGIAVVDLACDARFATPSVFSEDGFHPNDLGYSIMAAELRRAISSASYPTPQTSCPQMTLVPPL